jgi:hypothetical protein
VSSRTRPRTVLLTTLAIVLLVLAPAAMSIWSHRDEESDRRTRIDQQRPAQEPRPTHGCQAGRQASQTWLSIAATRATAACRTAGSSLETNNSPTLLRSSTAW